MNAIPKIQPAYEPCPNCNGSGLQLNYAGEPDTCRECHGDMVVRRRDEHGRFAGPKIQPASEQERKPVAVVLPVKIDAERILHGPPIRYEDVGDTVKDGAYNFMGGPL